MIEYTNLIEKLEELKKSELEREDLCDEEGYGDGEEIYEDGKSAGRYEQTVRIIEIVKQEAEQYNNGHFGCNTNGEHEKCNGCGLTDCKNRNKIWFGVSDDNNGWIPCSERLPEERDWYLAVFEEVDTGFIGIPYIADYLMGSHTKFTTEDGWIVRNCSDREDESAEYYKNLRCVAWQPLPQPYQPKGE